MTRKPLRLRSVAMRRLSRVGSWEHPTTATVVGRDRMARITSSGGLLNSILSACRRLTEQPIHHLGKQAFDLFPAGGEDLNALLVGVLDIAALAREFSQRVDGYVVGARKSRSKLVGLRAGHRDHDFGLVEQLQVPPQVGGSRLFVQLDPLLAKREPGIEGYQGAVARVGSDSCRAHEHAPLGAAVSELAAQQMLRDNAARGIGRADDQHRAKARLRRLSKF